MKCLDLSNQAGVPTLLAEGFPWGVKPIPYTPTAPAQMILQGVVNSTLLLEIARSTVCIHPQWWKADGYQRENGDRVAGLAHNVLNTNSTGSYLAFLDGFLFRDLFFFFSGYPGNFSKEVLQFSDLQRITSYLFWVFWWGFSVFFSFQLASCCLWSCLVLVL